MIRTKTFCGLLLGVGMVPVAGRANEPSGPTADLFINDWIALTQSAATVTVFICSVLGIGLVAWSIFQIAAEPDDPDRWKHVAAAVVGSLFTIIAVIVGWFSSLLAPGIPG